MPSVYCGLSLFFVFLEPGVTLSVPLGFAFFSSEKQNIFFDMEKAQPAGGAGGKFEDRLGSLGAQMHRGRWRPLRSHPLG
jgi:hypothetical protein